MSQPQRIETMVSEGDYDVAEVTETRNIPPVPDTIPPQSGVTALDSEPSTPRSTPPSGRMRRGPGTYDRTKTTDERREEQRRELLTASARVFAASGLAAASVSAVIEETGLSRGTFYRHFDDLNDAFVAVRQEAVERCYRVVAEAVREEEHPLRQLRAGIRAFLSIVAKHGDLARVFLREAPPSISHKEQLHRATVQRFVEMVQAGLERAVERGMLKTMPDELTVYALMVAMEGIAVRYLETREEHRALEAEGVLLDLCVRAFRPD
jgi:AcrR family transcriptional regulator